MDERFQRGIEKFNERDFYEAHELLEDLWHEYRETDRTFLQALIQISAGFYHLDCGNHAGARSQLTKGLQKLAPYQPLHKGIDTLTLANDINRCLAEIAPPGQARDLRFDPSLFPPIHQKS